MPTRESYREQIEKEFATAREALKIGNDGKARVCARRAAGRSITFFLSKHTDKQWGTDAVTQLMHLKDDPTFPEAVRSAAERLTTKISDQFTYPFSANPIEDARIIIDAVLQRIDSDVA